MVKYIVFTKKDRKKESIQFETMCVFEATMVAEDIAEHIIGDKVFIKCENAGCERKFLNKGSCFYDFKFSQEPKSW